MTVIRTGSLVVLWSAVESVAFKKDGSIRKLGRIKELVCRRKFLIVQNMIVASYK